MKDVGVEQIERVARQLVRDPCQPPGREERIALVDADVGAHAVDLGVGHHRGQRGKQPHHQEAIDEPPSPLVRRGFQLGDVRRIVAKRPCRLGGARDVPRQSDWQRRCAYKNMTREDENARPEQHAPFGSDGHAEPGHVRHESAFNRDVRCEKKESDRSRIGRARPCGKIVMP